MNDSVLIGHEGREKRTGSGENKKSTSNVDFSCRQPNEEEEEEDENNDNDNKLMVKRSR